MVCFATIFFPRNGHELVDYWRDLLPQMEHTDELGGFQLLEIRSSLPDELLMYADKLSMAHSLEVRVPYLDRTVVEYVQRLGADLKVRNGTRKWLHRQVCQSYLPPRNPKDERNAASPPTWWTNGFIRHSTESFGKCSWMKALLCLVYLILNRCEDFSKVTSPAARTTTSFCLAW